VPWEAPLYLGSLGRVVPPDIELVRAALAEQSMFQSLHPLVQGRHRQLRGVLEKQGDQEGATNLYMKARVPLAYIEKLDVESDYQKALGLVKVPGETEEDWRLRLEAAKNITRRSQNYASYWIGLAHYDLGNYSVAANWLDQLTLAVTPDGPWTTSARYNLARAYEADGKNDEARSIYLTDESPQRHGNILRARRLTATRP
jgi:tetratricopeptide (TPR) repeat protein